MRTPKEEIEHAKEHYRRNDPFFMTAIEKYPPDDFWKALELYQDLQYLCGLDPWMEFITILRNEYNEKIMKAIKEINEMERVEK